MSDQGERPDQEPQLSAEVLRLLGISAARAAANFERQMRVVTAARRPTRWGWVRHTDG